MQNTAQAVHLRVKAVADQLALTNGKGRLVHQRPADQRGQVAQIVQLLVQLMQQPPGEGGKLRLYLRQLFHGAAQRNHVPASCRAVDDAADQTLHVGHAGEGQNQLLPGHHVVYQRVHRVQTAVDGAHAQQRPLQPRTQTPGAHGGAGLIQHPQKGAFFLLAPQGLRQLQIAPGGEVQLHKLSLAVEIQCVDVAQIGFLRLMQIVQQRAQSQRGGRVAAGQMGQGLLTELFADGFFRRLRAKTAVAEDFRMAAEFILQQLAQRRAVGGAAVEHGLRRRKTAQLVHQMPHTLTAFKGGGVGLAGGHITGAQGGILPVQIDAGAEIGAPFVKARAVNHRAGGHHADNVALDKALGRGGILRLLADGHLVALGDQTGDIGIAGVVGHAAHGDLLLRRLVLGLVAAGQRQVQLPGRRAGIVAEHFVKITQSEKEDRAGILFFDFQILAHHGSQLCHAAMLLSCR